MNAPSVDEVKRDRKISNQARWLASVATLATLIKLWLAWKTQGTLDIPAYQDHLNKLREYGAAAYNLPGIFWNPLNVPPFAINLVRGAEFLATRTGVPFRFWFRLPAIFADAGSIWIVWQIAMRSPQLKIDFRLLLLMAICPASIMISGIHGNLDPLMIFGGLLSLFLLTQKGSTWLAGLVFGMALNIKVVPLIFAPTIFFYLPDLRPRLRFFCTALGLFLIGSLPHLLQNPFGIIGAVFGHAGMYSHWGWTLLLVMAQPQTPFSRESGFHPPGVHAVAAALGKYLLIASIISLSFWLNKKKSPPHLFVQSGVIAFLFMFLTPG